MRELKWEAACRECVCARSKMSREGRSLRGHLRRREGRKLYGRGEEKKRRR